MRNRNFFTNNFLAFLFFVFILSSCTPSRIVKPLKKGEQNVSGSFGGPMIKFAGAVTPLPFSTIGYAYGVSNKITAFGGLHTTSLLFGNLQTDIGLCAEIFSKNKFGISVTPALQTAVSYKDVKSFRIWPSLDANFRYEIKPGYFYTGAHVWFETKNTRVHELKQEKHALPNLHLGFIKTNTKWNHQFELKYLMPGTTIYPGVVDYVGINKKGAIGIYYAITRNF
ncbi:MAG: hypothetical protein JNM96_04785 [Bacteroidia bacterium]|nr:hypothetical protein [Bacteroidia bacterium]